MTPDEMIAVLKAHQAGKTIEYRNKNSDDVWEQPHILTWNFALYEYRVKPELRVGYGTFTWINAQMREKRNIEDCVKFTLNMTSRKIESVELLD